MGTRKQQVMQSINLLSEQRYLYDKFLKEDENKFEMPKLQVIPIEGKVNKYKISLFQKQNNGNLKDIMDNIILNMLGLKKEYASKESATIDVNEVPEYKLNKITNGEQN
jgi:hypothetical protein